MICRWAQELLCNQFTMVYMTSKMMGDVDALSRKYDRLLILYLRIADILKCEDEGSRPAAYLPHNLHNYPSTQKKPIDCQEKKMTVLTSTFLCCTSDESAKVVDHMILLIIHEPLSSVPVLLTRINTGCSNECHENINHSE